MIIYNNKRHLLSGWYRKATDTGLTFSLSSSLNSFPPERLLSRRFVVPIPPDRLLSRRLTNVCSLRYDNFRSNQSTDNFILACFVNAWEGCMSDTCIRW